MQDKRCLQKGCSGRHPKVCKWAQREVGCKRADCDFFHCTLAEQQNVINEVGYFKCASCKDVWQDQNCVVKHVVKHRELYFCLNCDDFVDDKAQVLDINWTLVDQLGNLRRDI